MKFLFTTATTAALLTSCTSTNHSSTAANGGSQTDRQPAQTAQAGQAAKDCSDRMNQYVLKHFGGVDREPYVSKEGQYAKSKTNIANGQYDVYFYTNCEYYVVIQVNPQTCAYMSMTRYKMDCHDSSPIEGPFPMD